MPEKPDPIVEELCNRYCCNCCQQLILLPGCCFSKCCYCAACLWIPGVSECCDCCLDATAAPRKNKGGPLSPEEMKR